MSAYSDWKCGALTDEEYRSAMRRECEDSIPFYSEEGHEEPLGMCETCKHCIEFKIHQRIIETHPQRFRDPEKPTVIQEDKTRLVSWVATDWKGSELESIWLCEVDRKEHMGDDWCEDYEDIDPT